VSEGNARSSFRIKEGSIRFQKLGSQLPGYLALNARRLVCYFTQPTEPRLYLQFFYPKFNKIQGGDLKEEIRRLTNMWQWSAYCGLSVKT
jgi:hypothetical protein